MRGDRAAFGHGAVWRIAGPMILSGATTPLLGMVDTAVVGHLPDAAYLGAVAIGATIFSALFMGLNFLRMGTTGVTAQAFGANNPAAVRRAFGQAAIMSQSLALLLLLAQQPLLNGAIHLLGPGPEVAEKARAYCQVRIWSAPASLLNFVLVGWLVGMQNARGPLVMMLVINSVNIVLDFVFVLGLGFGVRGVAAATLLAELAGAVIGLAQLRQELAGWPGGWSGLALGELGRYRRLFGINAALFLRTLALMGVFAFITGRGARLGDTILAANALLMNFQLMLSYVLDGIAYAAEALVGRAIGAGDRRGLALAVRRSLGWSLLVALLFTGAYAAGGGHLVRLLTDLADVRDAAMVYLPWLVVLPLVSVWSFLYDGVYVGATRSREMMVVMVGSAVLLFLPGWYLGEQAGLGNHALWLGFTAFMAGRAVGMTGWWRRIVRSESLEFGRSASHA